MKWQSLALAAATFIFAHATWGADVSANRSTATVFSNTHHEEGWIPSVGVGFGHLDQSGNADADGEGITAQVFGTYYFPQTSWLGEVGLGIHKQYLQDAASNPTVGIFSLSARYQFPYRWSIGPTADVLFGSGDEFGTANNYSTMLGVIGAKEFLFENDQLVRVGLKFTADVGQSGQSGTFVGLMAQWGFGSQNTVVRTHTASND